MIIQRFSTMAWYKTAIVIIVSCITTMSMKAATIVDIDGIRYSIDKGAASVIERDYYISKIVIPETIKVKGISYPVKKIGDSAFEDVGIKSVYIPNSVTSIGRYAFRGCNELTSINIPNGVTSIGESAFHGCSGLTAMTIPNSVTSIGNDAFYECSGLTSINIGNSVMSIGASAFSRCSSLTSITIPNSLISIGGEAFKDCSGLTSITIGNSVMSIGESAFSRCSSLTSITIPNSVKNIENGAFSDCVRVTYINIIGNNLTNVGVYAFSGCGRLTDLSLYVKATIPPAISLDLNTTLYVPTGSKEAYKVSKYWRDFKNIIELDIDKFPDATPTL